VGASLELTDEISVGISLDSIVGPSDGESLSNSVVATEGVSDVSGVDTESALLCCNTCISFEGIAGKVTVGT